MKTEFPISRRQFLAAAVAASVGAMLRTGHAAMPRIDLGERPCRTPDVKVLNHTELKKVSSTRQLSDGTWTKAGVEGHVIVCFNLEKGDTTIS